MAAYGTVMLGKLAVGASMDDWRKGLEDWKRERRVPGFQGEYALLGDDKRTIVSCVSFESEQAYRRLAEDPEQDQWYRERIAPLLEGDPQWIDGSWAD
ncbi:MAG TPA: hypothetical protein VFA11_15050 [Acidimicrobiales bacterium]|nr:hypothetical protein [Acidimicrobiales bacterium]